MNNAFNTDIWHFIMKYQKQKIEKQFSNYYEIDSEANTF